MTLSGKGREIARIAPYYALGLLVAFTLKLHYSHAGADSLGWILGPTCRLAGLLAGISLEREPGIGWIAREHRMIVGPACAGVNFLIVAFSCLFFSFVHRLKAAAARGAWLAGSLAAAFLLAVGTNSLRLVAAIRLREAGIGVGLLAPGEIHRLEGTVIYCLAILLAFLIADRLF